MTSDHRSQTALHLLQPVGIMTTVHASVRTAGAAEVGATRGTCIYYVLFFLSGMPALLYQIVWQRALFTIYGVNIESVTVIVTVFMLGLGLGSLVGGWLSKRGNIPLLAVFGAIELGIAVFGLVSLKVFHAVAFFTAGSSALQTGLVTFILLLIPTLFMGSTLPLLVAHLVRKTGNVGESVGALYSVNTFGSAIACFLAAYVLLRAFGESGCTSVAALTNACIATTAFVLFIRSKREPSVGTLEVPSAPGARSEILPFGVGLLVSGAVGFIALSYEVVWYRLYSLASGRSPACFALLLGWYLTGVAYGSLAVRDACRTKLRDDFLALLRAVGAVVLFGNVAAFLVGPAVAGLLRSVPLELTYPFVFLGAALLGAAFPLISHASIDPGQPGTGARLSYLYLFNIIGCAAGSYLVGFIAMDHLSIKSISVILLSIGLTLGCGVLLAAGAPFVSARRCVGLATIAILIFGSGPLYSGLYERLVFKGRYASGVRFRNVAESRTGVVTLTSDGRVYGGGVYDGHVSTDLINDVNGIFRAFALDALHPDPKEVLIIGLSMGAWAQVIANNPRVVNLTIVEIDSGYLRLIPQYPAVASLLRNPKVEIVIDDGRRWLVRNAGKQFDMIVMNTSQHWLAHASNLLSVEFLRLVRSHLKPGGIHYYNTTFSTDALLTGVTVFPYALRVGNFLAVSDRPIGFDKARWGEALSHYTVDGRPVVDLDNAANRAALDGVLALADTLNDRDVTEAMRIESIESLRQRFKNSRLITDDNMGTEWIPPQRFGSLPDGRR
jgi:spermidine synthase